MKCKVVMEEKPFLPFKLELTIESAGEARLMYHCFNHPESLRALREGTRVLGPSGMKTVGPNRYEFDRYSQNVAWNFTDSGVAEILKAELEKQVLTV